MNTVIITEEQKEQFNEMLKVLRHIDKGYMTTEELRKDSESEYGLDYEEALEMAYENILTDLRFAIKDVNLIR